MDVTVEPLTHSDALSAEDQRAYAAVLNAAWSAWNPDHVPWTIAAARARARVHAPPSVARYLVARDPDGSLVGVGQVHWRDGAPGGGLARIVVAPTHRRRGIARALGARLADVARSAGRTGLTVEAADGDAGLAGALKRHGFRRDLAMELNAVRVADVDDELLRRWAARGEATPGYSLVAYDAPAPEGLIEALVAVRHVMNTAPLREGEPEEHYTVGELRAFEAAVAAAEQDWWAVAARHDATGELVGLSELYLPRLAPPRPPGRHRRPPGPPWPPARCLDEGGAPPPPGRRAPRGAVRAHLERGQQRPDPADQPCAWVPARRDAPLLVPGPRSTGGPGAPGSAPRGGRASLSGARKGSSG